MTAHSKPQAPSAEAGFTLAEALIAMVVLSIGLIAISSLFLVAGTSRAVANQGTAAVSIASQQMEVLKAIPFTALVAGGNEDTDQAAGGVNFFRDDLVPGVGNIHTRWAIVPTAGDPSIYFVQVRSQGGMAGRRLWADFTSFRSCTDATLGCP